LGFFDKGCDKGFEASIGCARVAGCDEIFLSDRRLPDAGGVRPSPGAATLESPTVWASSYALEIQTLLRPGTGALRLRLRSAVPFALFRGHFSKRLT
jgi:hypothetical protein